MVRVCLVLCLAVGVANAGPIPWSYKANIVRSAPTVQTSPEGGDSITVDPVGPPTFDGVKFDGAFSSDPGATTTTPVAWFNSAGAMDMPKLALESFGWFDFSVQLTDTASGATDEVMFHGMLTMNRDAVDFDKLPIPQLLFNFNVEPGSQMLRLGANTYTVMAFGTVPTDGDDLLSLGLTIRVEANTPEPATLLLAGLGLIGLGVRTVRRRMA